MGIVSLAAFISISLRTAIITRSIARGSTLSHKADIDFVYGRLFLDVQRILVDDVHILIMMNRWGLTASIIVGVMMMTS